MAQKWSLSLPLISFCLSLYSPLSYASSSVPRNTKSHASNQITSLFSHPDPFSSEQSIHFLFIDPPRSDFDTYPFLPTLQSSKPMSSTGKKLKFHVKHPVVVDVGCSCRKPKLSPLSSSSSPPLPKQRNKCPNFSFSPPSITNTRSSFAPSNTPSSPSSQDFYSPKLKKSSKKSTSRMEEESVAVEKESSDPFVDFRNSMLQMIVEKEIYSWDDLTELLHLFLSLNSPCHHKLILQAFGEILHGVL